MIKLKLPICLSRDLGKEIEDRILDSNKLVDLFKGITHISIYSLWRLELMNEERNIEAEQKQETNRNPWQLNDSARLLEL